MFNQITSFIILAVMTLIINDCFAEQISIEDNSPMTIDLIAQDYVKLSLLIGQHHASYIDAYYGPKEWQPTGEPKPLTSLAEQAHALSVSLSKLTVGPSEQQRIEFLKVQLDAAAFFIDHILDKNQQKSSFNSEAKGLYDAISPEVDLAKLDVVLAKLNILLKGKGSLNTRLSQFNEQFVIPKNKLEQVFDAAINEARTRTKKYIDLPVNEHFTIEYVTDKIWSGYNWYKGNNYSLIQINTDFPIHIDRAIDLASHEGYPARQDHYKLNF